MITTDIEQLTHITICHVSNGKEQWCFMNVLISFLIRSAASYWPNEKEQIYLEVIINALNCQFPQILVAQLLHISQMQRNLL